jgi:hypothetical protein
MLNIDIILCKTIMIDANDNFLLSHTQNSQFQLKSTLPPLVMIHHLDLI